MAGHKGEPYYDIFLRYEMWLETIGKERILDGEGFDLLLDLDQTGSLTASARNLGMSYRKAWGMLNEVERHLGFMLTEKRRGGAAGGRTVLSEKGVQLVRAYNSLRHETDIAMKSIAKVFFNRINEINGMK
ncbi:MAG: LysR family transcriptional regulator [Bacteroidales bacterium]|jgi:molybdate transport repressor ModE-like protein|nr:LysR family transcriptional regulator [Bacteroidales bacterium]MCB9029195.1 LysR family transcriptional regulator [Bacteroidales bacterium]NLD64934.1 LysR family transcriptional regulator [Bacteroidales bacterium]HNT93827.1 LysR family transcriptional regulator [Bacteroidales bacterium]HOO67095.1 LysR family transcriptional regulator [Bacteroidales bacterium]